MCNCHEQDNADAWLVSFDVCPHLSVVKKRNKFFLGSLEEEEGVLIMFNFQRISKC